MSVAIIRKPRRGSAQVSLYNHATGVGNVKSPTAQEKAHSQRRNKIARQSRRENRRHQQRGG